MFCNKTEQDRTHTHTHAHAHTHTHTHTHTHNTRCTREPKALGAGELESGAIDSAQTQLVAVAVHELVAVDGDDEGATRGGLKSRELKSSSAQQYRMHSTIQQRAAIQAQYTVHSTTHSIQKTVHSSRRQE